MNPGEAESSQVGEYENGARWVTHPVLLAAIADLRREMREIDAAMQSWRHDHLMNVEAKIDREFSREKEKEDIRRAMYDGRHTLIVADINKLAGKIEGVDRTVGTFQKLLVIAVGFGTVAGMVLTQVVSWALRTFLPVG